MSDTSSQPHPMFIMRHEGNEILPWHDVPVAIQKKILDGTMASEDWDADWSKYE